MIPPRELVLSGGGMKVVSIIGALHELENNGLLKSLKTISGVSAGAWLGFMISCEFSIKKLEQLVLELDFGVIRNITPESFIEFPETYGIDDGSKLMKFLESVLRNAIKVEPYTTFADLNKNKIQFRCWATDLNMYIPREFSIKTTPNVRIIDALHASMSIPFYYTPVIDPVTGHYLSDGGIQGAMPMYNLTEDECKYAIGIGFLNNLPNDNPVDFMDFMKRVLSSVINVQNNSIMKKWEDKIIKISANDITSLNFEVSREERIKLLKSGSESAKKWIQGKYPIKIIRRHSLV